MDLLIKKLISRKTFSIKSQGDSMNPIFYSGDVVIYKKIPFNTIKVNDIVLFLKNKKYITHRVVYKAKGYILTKGDNNKDGDGKIFPHQYIAKAVKVKKDEKIFLIEHLYLVQSSLYFKELILLKNELDIALIDYVFLKGLPLHLLYENKHPRRIYADCDILISPHADKNRVARIFKKLGYSKIEDKEFSYQMFSNSPIVEEDYWKEINGIPIFIDVHFDISMSTVYFPNLRRRLRQLTLLMLSSKRRVKIKNEEFLILNGGNLLLYLFIHQVNHAWSNMLSLNFMSKLIQGQDKKGGADWKRALDVGKMFKLINFIIPSLILLRKYYHIKKLYKYCQQKYSKNILYTSYIYDNILTPSSSFKKYISKYLPLNREKLLIRFFLYDAPLLIKIGELFQIKLFVYAILLLFKKLYKRRSLLS